MEYTKLQKLIDQIDQSSLAYIDYKTDAEHVVLSKEVPKQSFQQDTTSAVASPSDSSAYELASSVTEVATEPKPEEIPGDVVESPMVGVVYLQPSPSEEVFVQVGSQVEKGDRICIIEAMKLMNEIQAHKSGIVTEILVENEEVVEYKQPLIRID